MDVDAASVFAESRLLLGRKAGVERDSDSVIARCLLLEHPSESACERGNDGGATGTPSFITRPWSRRKANQRSSSSA